MTYAVIRVRGKINLKPDIKKTLNLLNLTRSNHCVIIPEDPYYKGMLQTAKDYITWGDVDKPILNELISKRGMLKGDKKLTESYIKSATSYASFDKLTDAIINKNFKYKDIPEIKPIFRLNPPVKGYEGVKRSFKNNGALGYRGKNINELIKRMI